MTRQVSKPVQIHIRDWRGRQSVEHDGLWKIGPHLVRVYLKSDFYPQQCEGYVEVWSLADLRWNRIAYIPYPLLNIVHYKEDQRMDEERTRRFNKDESTLLQMATLILTGEEADDAPKA